MDSLIEINLKILSYRSNIIMGTSTLANTETVTKTAMELISTSILKSNMSETGPTTLNTAGKTARKMEMVPMEK